MEFCESKPPAFHLLAAWLLLKRHINTIKKNTPTPPLLGHFRGVVNFVSCPPLRKANLARLPSLKFVRLLEDDFMLMIDLWV